MRNISDHDFKIANRYLFLSMAIEVIQKDLDTLRNNNIFKISEPYLDLMESIERKAVEERRALKKDMYRYNLEVLLTDKTEKFTEYTYYTGRKEEKRRYFNPAIRKKVRNILVELLKNSHVKV